MANCQVTFSPVPGGDGVMELTTNGAPSGANFFYLLGDGFFSTQKSPVRQYNTIGAAGYTAKSFVLNSYGGQPPSFTGNSGSFSGIKVDLVYNFPTDPHVAISWNPSNVAANYYLLKVFRPQNDRSGCINVKFYYNTNQVVMEGAIIDNSNSWFTYKSNTTFNDRLYNREITWEYNSLLPGETGVIYIPLKPLVL
ncbi:MAG: hypothetical protein IPO92_18100 [Saprospiraceae bacterium]|nr:hypothetical protein [Saprospiraceae bacterium]